MEWVLRSPQVHSIFGSLGYHHADGYHINKNCNESLETILYNILTEDRHLRSYRRNISFGQNIKKDLIPLLIYAKEDKTIELLVRILVNLTIPVECLLSLDTISKTDFGRHTIFELNNLLQAAKTAFTDNRTTKVIIEHLKKNLENDKRLKTPAEYDVKISNCLLLLRNILHIPEETKCASPCHNISSVQNQILWNIFSQSIDKVLIKLMIIPDGHNWSVTIVQLIALLYKDQHVVTLHKLLNIWLESSISESSEDNESNTSPPDRGRGSEDSSPILTSDPTSDSSDTGGSGKCTEDTKQETNDWIADKQNAEKESDTFLHPADVKIDVVNKIKKKGPTVVNTETMSISSECDSITNEKCSVTKGNIGPTTNTRSEKTDKKKSMSENSDCGYVTQIENQESISTSSNEDDLPAQKSTHQKPHNHKQWTNTKNRPGTTLQERKRKRIVKRGKSNIINVQGLTHKTPTDDDISNVLKEFTVDFLLKGYNPLVQTLHSQIMTNNQLEIDISHFFWLVTYFLKFATQIELDLEHMCAIMSFDMVSYLTAEGVYLCEQFELAIKLDGNDLKPSIRRLHLVVTAIRELVQAIEVYRKLTHVPEDAKDLLTQLEFKMCETEELRSLFVLLLQHYNPKYHNKQYLQDLIVTNHILLLFLDNIMRQPNYKGSANMVDHIKQFSTSEIMLQYGLLLEDYEGNGEFVNDCIFTMMHHVGGELRSSIALFQPNILKTFTAIWQSEYEICDDWSDLIEYVINTFVKKPKSLNELPNIELDLENLDDKFFKQIARHARATKEIQNAEETKERLETVERTNTVKDKHDAWTEEELSSLNWNYMQCNSNPDIIGDIVKLYKDDGINKTRSSVIMELYKQNIINKTEYESFIKSESDKSSKSSQSNKGVRLDEISKLCEQLLQEGQVNCLEWVQKVLLNTCYVKIYLSKKESIEEENDNKEAAHKKTGNFEEFKRISSTTPLLPPVAYHSILWKQSIPLVPWNCEQAAICKDLKFLRLLNKLGFQMPVDTGKMFIRIPCCWSATALYDIAEKISPIDKRLYMMTLFYSFTCSHTGKLWFSLSDMSNSSEIISATKLEDCARIDNCYRKQKPKHFTPMVNFTPMPGPSMHCNETEKFMIAKETNWLEVIRQSQECKVTLTISRNINSEYEETNVETLVKTTSEKITLATVPCMIDTAINIPPPFSIPETTIFNADETHFMPISAEFDDNNSVCETASVASDLTRMYVSDEDEKMETPLTPVPADSDAAVYTDSDAPSGKRPRVSSPHDGEHQQT